MLKLVVQLFFLVLMTGWNICAQSLSSNSLEQRAAKLEPFINDSAGRYGVEPRILWVLCYLESRFRLDAVSAKGARGPMQFMPGTAARYGLTNPRDPQTSIAAAARYFRDLLRRFEGRLDLAFAAYNAGEGSVEAFKNGYSLRLSNGRVINPRRVITSGVPPYRETQAYVNSALRLFNSGRASSLHQSLTKRPPILVSRDFTIDVTDLHIHSRSSSKEKETPQFIDVP